MKLPDRWKRPLARKALGIASGLLVLWAVAGFLVLPGILRRGRGTEARGGSATAP